MKSEKEPVYLDYASTTPVDQRVLDEMLPYFINQFANASSNHNFGETAKSAIEKSRKQIAELINCKPSEITFTSGSTESINLGLKGFLAANPEKGEHIITIKTEHKAVLATCDYLETLGYEVTYLDVDENGLVLIDDIKNSIQPNTALICVMYVNNEIGVVQPIAEIGRIAKEHNITFFCDATQAVGKLNVDVVADAIDMLCFSGHKLNGPKGIGILYKRETIVLTPLIHGGGQENGLRSGTYNTPLIVGLGKACEIAQTEFGQNVKNILLEREKWEHYFEENNYGTVCFKNINHAPHIISIRLNTGDAEDFLLRHKQDFAASTGSACNSEIVEPSHVLKAWTQSEIESRKYVRISISSKQNN